MFEKFDQGFLVLSFDFPSFDKTALFPTAVDRKYTVIVD
jgi:hypothetical protein